MLVLRSLWAGLSVAAAIGLLAALLGTLPAWAAWPVGAVLGADLVLLLRWEVRR